MAVDWSPMEWISFFYFGVAGVRLLLAGVYSLAMGKDICRLDLSTAIARCPSWLPYGYLKFLHRPALYRTLYHSVPLSLILAGMWPEAWPLRLLAALHFAHVHLALTSLTHGHDEYISLWTLLALTSPVSPEIVGPGVALASSMYLMFASGIGKLVVGGGRRWIEPETMKAVLRSTIHLPAPIGPALPKSVVRFVISQPALLKSMAIGTLVLEVGLPLGFFLPSGLPLLFGCLAFHAGHASLMSVVIGFPFAMNHLPVYLLGFLAAWPLFSSAWILGVALFSIVVVAVLLRSTRMLPEDWPSTSFPLFAHSGAQQALLIDPVTEGRQRLIVYSEQCADPPIGCALDKPWWQSEEVENNIDGVQAESASQPRVYDAWHLCFGWTHSVEPMMFRRANDPAHLARLVEDWLNSRSNGKFYERSSGRPLSRARLVQLDSSGTVVERLG